MTRGPRRGAAVALGALLALPLTGCWNNRAIEHRAIVLVLGIDRGRDGNLVTLFQIPTPQALTGFTNGGSRGPTSFVIQGEGPTVGKAATFAQAKSDRELFFGQTQLILFSAALTPAELESAANYLARVGPLDKTAFVAVTPVSVSDVLSYEPHAARFSALYFATLFSCNTCQEVGLARTLWDFEQRYVTPGSDNWLPVIAPSGGDYLVSQVAIYRGPSLVLSLSPAQTVYFGYLVGRTSKAALSVPTALGRIGVRAIRASPHLAVRLENGRAMLDVDLRVKATLDTLPAGEATLPNLALMETATSDVIMRQTAAVVRKLQAAGVDPLDFFRTLVWQHPELRPRWRELLRKAGLRVRVQTRIVDVGDVT